MKKKLIVIGMVLISLGISIHSMAGIPGCRATFGQTLVCSDGVAF